MMRIIEITEQDKMKLGEYGREAVNAIQRFIECLDKTTDGAIGEAMAERYGERQGVKGTGPYGRGGSYYNRRDGEQYMEHYPNPPYDERNRMPYREEHHPNVYDERYGYRESGNYGNRYMY